MSLTMVNVDVRDDWIGAKNTELDELMIKWLSEETNSSFEDVGFYPAPLNRAWRGIWVPPSISWVSLTLYSSFLDHPSPTLVSHPCLYLSARHISYSLWHFVSCGDPDSTIQGSRPYKWGQDVSCGYLMRRWQPLLELLLHHAPMAGPLRLCFPLGCSRRLPLVTWRFPLLRSRFAEDRVVLGSTSWQFRLSLFVLGHFFLLGMGHGLDMKWAGVAKSIDPTITLQNPVVWLLGLGGGFWCSQA